jgi:alkyl sulfatase BDS1-like metallo-beta-lactamase superfamily hydrolase
VCSSDLWCFPNAGNPQKVQRFPVEWAAAMRDMAAQGAELFLPAHGLPVTGAARIKRVLTDVAECLEFLVRETIGRMNQGARLDEIVHEVSIDSATLEKPYLRPIYDEPEFVVRNIWRLYGGWYDGNPAHLKPAPDDALAAELARLAGGPRVIAERAAALSGDNPRLACHLAEFAVQAAPDDKELHSIRAEVYQQRRGQESSLMAKGIYGAAANESKAHLEE